MTGASARLQCRADEGDGSGEISEHELIGDAHHTKTETPQLEIAARVSKRLARVIAAIHFNDEFASGSAEVSNEPAYDDLAAELG